MSQVARNYIILSAALCALAALLHLAAPLLGARWYEIIGAPAGLIRMLDHGSARPAITCLVIASTLAIWSAYGLSAAGHLRRLPVMRAVLSVVGVTLLARGLALPAMAVLAPDTLSGLCGRCQGINGFVLLTSALCLFVGAGYAVAALQPAPDASSKPKPFRGSA